MKKQLSVIGNSLGIIIEKPILELLDINRDTELEMRTDGERLFIEPVRNSTRTNRQKRLAESAKRVMAAHDATFRKLAK